MPTATLLTVVILITLSGVPIVNIQIPVTVGVNVVELPVEPLEVSLAVMVNGSPAPFLLIDSTLYIVSDIDGVAEIIYVANFDMLSDGIIRFNVSEAYVKLYIPDNVVLLTPPNNVSRLSSEIINGTRYTVIEFYGSQTIEYIVLNVSTQTVTTPTSTTTLTQTTIAPTVITAASTQIATPTTVVTLFTQTTTTYTIGTTTSTQTRHISPYTTVSTPQIMSPSSAPSIPAPVPETTTTVTIITSADTTPHITTAPTTQQTTQTVAPHQTATTTGAADRGLTMYIIAAAIATVLVIAVVLLLRRRFA